MMTNLREMGQKAVAAKYALQILDTDIKNQALTAAAEGLLKRQDEILEANRLDMENGEKN